ncbi:MAG: GNAT family N-acetyltransferase [Gammaproteobacteria bacterium]|nr:GNAT family N-acetyltransferase [Gammaproteobacteria bacterium]
MHSQIIQSLSGIPIAQWQSLLGGEQNPFLQYEFLSALEHHGCVSPSLGWQAHHVLHTDADRIIGMLPAYIKYNSYGELVFDWAWAEAYGRAGLHYYPKLVCAVPYTPASGPRLLASTETARAQLIQTLQQQVELHQLSSAHVLFTQEADNQAFANAGWLARLGCQFHWHNQGYANFDDFLQRLSSRKRKQIRKEREQAHSHGLVIERILGCDASNEQWQAMTRFYRSTFEEKNGLATLNLPFFLDIARSMGQQVLLILARRGDNYLAGALLFHNQHTLWGRHWGCDQNLPGLHFELCYYQGIEFAIENQLQTFEPGAQGEHKIARGFLPTATWSWHWIADPQFRRAISDYCQREQHAMRQYMQELQNHSPYRHEDNSTCSA